MRWLRLIEQYAPLVLLAIPGIPSSIIPFVVHGIQAAESIKGASGEQKLAAAQAIVSDGVTVLNSVKPNAIDAGSVNAAVAAGISATVNVVNAIHSINSKE